MSFHVAKVTSEQLVGGVPLSFKVSVPGCRGGFGGGSLGSLQRDHRVLCHLQVAAPGGSPGRAVEGACLALRRLLRWPDPRELVHAI